MRHTIILIGVVLMSSNALGADTNKAALDGVAQIHREDADRKAERQQEEDYAISRLYEHCPAILAEMRNRPPEARGSDTETLTRCAAERSAAINTKRDLALSRSKTFLSKLGQTERQACINGYRDSMNDPSSFQLMPNRDFVPDADALLEGDQPENEVLYFRGVRGKSAFGGIVVQVMKCRYRIVGGKLVFLYNS